MTNYFAQNGRFFTELENLHIIGGFNWRLQRAITLMNEMDEFKRIKEFIYESEE